MQELMRRLMNVAPEPRSLAAADRVVAVALNTVVRESFKLYRCIYDGIINLLDKFFEMEKVDATKVRARTPAGGRPARPRSAIFLRHRVGPVAEIACAGIRVACGCWQQAHASNAGLHTRDVLAQMRSAWS